MENTANSAIATHIECVIDQGSEHYDQLMRVLSRRSLLKGLHGYSGHVKASSSYWVSHYHPLSFGCQSVPPDVGCWCIYVCSNACGCAPTCGVCVWAWKRPSWEGSCMWTYVHLLPPPHCPFPNSLCRVQVSVSLSSLSCPLAGKQSRTHTHVNTQTIQNQSTFYY